MTGERAVKKYDEITQIHVRLLRKLRDAPYPLVKDQIICIAESQKSGAEHSFFILRKYRLIDSPKHRVKNFYLTYKISRRGRIYLDKFGDDYK